MTMEVSKFEDMCRCCHAEGGFKSLFTPYFSLVDDKEAKTPVVYADVLRECFNIEMFPVTEPYQQQLVSVICELCIQKLHDANDFKHLVQKCEKKFWAQYYQRVGRKDFFLEVNLKKEDVYCKEVNTAELKQVKSECKGNGEGISDHDNDAIALKEENTTISKDMKEVIHIPSHKEIVKRKVGRPKKSATLDEEISTEENTATSKDIKEVIHIPSHKEIVKRKVGRPKKSATLDEDIATDNIETSTKLKRSTIRITDKIKRKKKPDLLKKITIKKDTEQNQDSGKAQLPPFQLQKDVDYTLIKNEYHCTRCELKTNRLRRLRDHVKYKHLNMAKYTCPICFKEFQTPAPFVIHKYEEHNLDERFKCNACDKIFNAKRHLTIHLRYYHMLGDKVKCDKCNFESFNRISLYKHKFIHRTVKEFKCKFCEKSFLRKHNLQFHERIHTGDKRKVCKVCGEAFVQKASLNYHMGKYHPGVDF